MTRMDIKRLLNEANASSETSVDCVHPVIIQTKLPVEARDVKEDWSGISDPARRRKLQNRLHQRAWRKHLAHGCLTEKADLDREASGRRAQKLVCRSAV
jgi:hypothetical protein